MIVHTRDATSLGPRPSGVVSVVSLLGLCQVGSPGGMVSEVTSPTVSSVQGNGVCSVEAWFRLVLLLKRHRRSADAPPVKAADIII